MRAPVVTGVLAAAGVLWLTSGPVVALLLVLSAVVLWRVQRHRTPSLLRAPKRRVWSDEQRSEILERDGWRCVECFATEELEIDHIIPFSRGGACSVDNAQVLCGPCNRRKGAS